MKKRALRICMIFVVLMMLFMLPCMADSANAETKEIDVTYVHLEPGYSVVPMHGMDIFDYRKDLKFYTLEESPIIGIAVKQWYVWNNTTFEWDMVGVNDYSGDTFDCHKRYKCGLQVRIPAKEGNTDLRFKEGVLLNIDDKWFDLKSQNVVGGTVNATFECREIIPRYIRVKGIEINENNMNDVLGDADEGSTVSYDITHNILSLNNADLVFDEKSVAPALGNTEDDPYMVYAVNTGFTINLIGNNRISAAGRTVTDYWQLAGINIICTDDNPRYLIDTFHIMNEGTLEINVDGDDINNTDKYLFGIVAPDFDVFQSKLTINGKNAQVFNGIATNGNDNPSVIKSAEVTVTDENISDVAVGIYNEADRAYPLRIDGSKVRLQMRSSQPIGFMVDRIILTDRSKISVIADGLNGNAIWSELLDIIENVDKTALVNTEGIERGRTVWDGETNLCNTYKYVRIPGLAFTEAKEPTATESGNIAYYYDDLDDKYFADAAGNQELSESDITIPPTGPSEEELERAAALADLNSALSDAKAVSNADGKYTADSYQALQDAIASAETVAAKENATTEDLKVAKSAVEAAKAALVEASSGTDPVDPTPVDPVDPTPVDPVDPTPDDPTPVDPVDPTPIDPVNPQPEPIVTPTTPAAPAEIVDLPAVKISKPKAAKKAATVKWKKVSKKNQKKIQGIEIQVATDAGFTNIVKTSTASKKKTSKKIKGLTAKKTYYVRIRAYKNAADGKHVSVWKTKKVKIK